MGTKNRGSLAAGHGRAKAKSGADPKTTKPAAHGNPSRRENGPSIERPTKNQEPRTKRTQNLVAEALRCRSPES
jgi:hypothetical protein